MEDLVQSQKKKSGKDAKIPIISKVFGVIAKEQPDWYCEESWHTTDLPTLMCEIEETLHLPSFQEVYSFERYYILIV